MSEGATGIGIRGAPLADRRRTTLLEGLSRGPGAVRT